MIPWLLEFLDFVLRENITLLNQLTHPPNSRKELEAAHARGGAHYRVLNAEPENRGHTFSWASPTTKRPHCSTAMPWRRTCGL